MVNVLEDRVCNIAIGGGRVTQTRTVVQVLQLLDHEGLGLTGNNIHLCQPEADPHQAS
jgi:hypothetical protein